MRPTATALPWVVISLSELKTQADGLSRSEREDLISHLLLGLGSPAVAVGDDEVDAREREMDTGEVDLVPHGEFSALVRGGEP